MFGNQFFMCVTWAINSMIILGSNWFSSDVLIHVSQLTPDNLDRLVYVVRLVNNIIAYAQPVISQVDPAILNRVLGELLRLSNYLIFFWSRCQDVLDSGQLSTGHYEAVEVYHGILLNAINGLQGLIASIRAVLNT